MTPVAPLIGESPGIVAIRESVHLITVQPGSRRLPTVHLSGETGTGKGLLARTLHAASGRGRGPFVDVDCPAIPETLIEAELFGFERGAFTDARRAKTGLLQAANGGTLFLDEIGLLSQGLQSKLLKAVEEQAVRRLGSTRSELVDVWIISATNEDLAVATNEGRFRRDLYHRLTAVRLVLPPLRERGQDILLLADHFLSSACADFGISPKTLGPDARAALLAYRWPGNVRELANVVERAALLSREPVIGAESLGLPPAGNEGAQRRSPDYASRPLKEAMSGFERTQLLEALRNARGNVALAAERLGLPRSTLRYRIARLELGEHPTASRPWSRVVAARPSNAPALTWELREVALLRARLAAPPGADRSASASRSHEACVEKVGSFGGRFEPYPPNGTVAVFGLEPVEDAPIRAVLAALAIRKALGQAGPVGAQSVVAAIHVSSIKISRTGDQISIDRADLRHGTAVLDELIQGAEPGAILVSEIAAQFLARRFDLESYDRRDAAKGSAYRVNAGTLRLQHRLTRFVGREPEFQQLLAAWERTKSRQGQVVSVVGEAGLGKTRLVDEFKEQLSREGVQCVGGSCFAYGDSISYLPFLEITKQVFGLDVTSEVDAKRRIGQVLATLDLDPSAVAPYLHNLLVSHVDDDALSKLPAHLVRERTVNALKTLVVALARHRPLALVIEDVHWIDKATEEVVGALVEALVGLPLLLLLVYRPEYLHAWVNKAYHAQITLSRLAGASSAEMVRAILSKPYASKVPLKPLSPEESTVLIRELLGATVLPPQVEQLIVTTADGNPFFVEELTLSLRESGHLARMAARGLDRPLETLQLPATLQGTLLARTDRLNDDLKDVLQIASVIGRVFGYPVLAHALEHRAGLDDMLSQLGDLEFIYRTRLAQPREYSFKHVLTQQAVYDALLPEKRLTYHERVGRALEALYSDRLEEFHEVLAHHYSRTANSDKAVDYLALAHGKAVRANAMSEAKAYFDEAMQLLDTMPETERNRRRRISLLVNRSTMFTLLFKVPEYYDLLRRYQDMAVGLADGGLLRAFYSDMGCCEMTFGQYDRAIQTCTKALQLSGFLGGQEDAALAYVVLQWSYLYKGDYTKVFALHGDLARAIEQQFTLRWYLQGVAAVSQAYSFLGQWGPAIDEGHKALKVGERFSDNSVISCAAWLISRAYTLKGDLKRALEYGEVSVRTAPTPRDKAWAWATLGYAWCRAGEPHRGIQMLAEAVSIGRRAAYRANEVFAPFLGEAYFLTGEYELAIRTLEESLAISNECGMKFSVASSHRLLGEISMRINVTQRAEPLAAPHFEKSIALLREINAENELALAYAGYGRVHKQRGDVGEARTYFTKALEILERLGTVIEPDDVRASLAEL